MQWTDQSEEFLWDSAFGRKQPRRRHSSAQKTASDEDVIFVEVDAKLDGGDEACWNMYCLCDGHAGIEAAEHVKNGLWDELQTRLPKTCPSREYGITRWAKQIRDAITQAFHALDDDFSLKFGTLCQAGSTVTVALTCGWFLTVANIGDSEAVIDTGLQIELMTHSHRLEDCEKERKRLVQAGMQLARLAYDLSGPAEDSDAGLGPQRCWPGGLANARSIGDLEAGQHVLSSPYIKQCILPEKGARLIIGSDGLWDIIDHRTACVITRPNCNKSSADRLVTQAIYRNDWVVHDDTTVLVTDFLPTTCQEFPQICKALRNSLENKRGRAGAFLGCFCASVVNGMEEESTEYDNLICIAETDGVTDKESDTIPATLDISRASSNSTTERSTSLLTNTST